MEQKIDNSVEKTDNEISIIETFGSVCEKIRKACFNENRSHACEMYDDIMDDMNLIRHVLYSIEFGKFYNAGINKAKDIIFTKIDNKPEPQEENGNVIHFSEYKDSKKKNDNE